MSRPISQQIFISANASHFPDQSTLDVVEADGTPISGPSAVHRVPLHNGQRVRGHHVYLSVS